MSGRRERSSPVTGNQWEGGKPTPMEAWPEPCRSCSASRGNAALREARGGLAQLLQVRKETLPQPGNTFPAVLQPQALPHLPQGTEAFLATNNARMWHRHRGAARAAKSLCLLNPCSLHFGSEAFSKAQETPVQGRACFSGACLPAAPAFVGFWPPNPECFVTANPKPLGLKLC